MACAAIFTIVAPTGQPCDWTRAATERAAINKLLGAHRRRLWDYAFSQGYRIRIERHSITQSLNHPLTEAST